MKTKSGDLLPKILPGTVCAQMIRCAKPKCRCARGELHGPYYYHFTRVGGKLIKRYLRAHEVEQIRAACLAYREEKRAARARSYATWQMIREMKARLRDVLKQFNSFTED